MLRRIGLFVLFILLAAPAVAQTERWVGIVQKIEGRWEFLNEKNEKIRDIKLYLPVPAGAKIKIIGASGRANGYVKIAFRNGTFFEACCSGLMSCPRRTDCGEPIALPQESNPTALSRLMALASDFLAGGPEKYLVNTVGVRSSGAAAPAPDLVIADGILSADQGTLNLGPLVQRNPDGDWASGKVYFVEIGPIVDGGAGAPVSKPVRIDWKDGEAQIESFMKPGLYRLAILRSEAGKLEPTDEDLWVLLAGKEKLADLQQQFTALSPSREGLDPALAGALFRAFLQKLAADQERQ